MPVERIMSAEWAQLSKLLHTQPTAHPDGVAASHPPEARDEAAARIIKNHENVRRTGIWWNVAHAY